MNLETNNNSTLISNERPKDTEVMYNNGRKIRSFNELLTKADNHEWSCNQLENDLRNTSSSVNITNEVLNGSQVDQDQLSSFYRSQYIQKRFTTINSSSRRGKIIGKNGALISRTKSMSSPAFVLRKRTISEKEEENDKVCLKMNF